MASITRRGKASYQAEVRRKGLPKTSRCFNTRAQAEAWARKIESDLEPAKPLTDDDCLLAVGRLVHNAAVADFIMQATLQVLTGLDE